MKIHLVNHLNHLIRQFLVRPEYLLLLIQAFLSHLFGLVAKIIELRKN